MSNSSTALNSDTMYYTISEVILTRIKILMSFPMVLQNSEAKVKFIMFTESNLLSVNKCSDTQITSNYVTTQKNTLFAYFI